MTSLRIGLASLAALVLGCATPPGAEPGSTSSASATTGAGAGSTVSSSHASSGSGGAAGGAGGSGGIGGAGGSGVEYPVPDWPIATPADVGLDAAALDAAANIAAGDGSFCLLVIRHGKLVAETYFNGADATTRNPSWSLAKSYTSTLVGIAIDRGDIKSLDESASDFVPSWKGTDHEPITIRHLVSMTSGLEWDVFDDYIGMATFAQDDTAYALNEPVADPPGTKWTYDNAGVQVLEAVFEGATGGTLEDYANKYLWPAIGMSATWKHDPSGKPTAYANVLASCRDHARFGYLYLHGGTWSGGAQVVSKNWIALATTPSQPINQAYGFLIWLNGGTPAEDAMMEPWPGEMVPFAPPDLFAARGFGNQFVDVIPSLDMIVVRFGQDPAADFDIAALTTDSRFETHDQILQPILAAVKN